MSNLVSGVYGATAVDSIDGSTNSDGLFEAFCGVLFGEYNCVGDPCKNGGRCLDGANTYSCVCPEGYNGRQCENDINECAQSNGAPCGTNAGCQNKNGAFVCRCLAGFEGGQWRALN